MANKKSVGPAGPGEMKAAWFMPEQMVRVPIGELVPYARNARTHSESQIAQIRASLREFGLLRPLLIDRENRLVAGQAVLQAAMAEGMDVVPCILAEGLTAEQRRAYILADNRLAELAEWDRQALRRRCPSAWTGSRRRRRRTRRPRCRGGHRWKAAAAISSAGTGCMWGTLRPPALWMRLWTERRRVCS